jgi:hypothetical protein
MAFFEGNAALFPNSGETAYKPTGVDGGVLHFDLSMPEKPKAKVRSANPLDEPG